MPFIFLVCVALIFKEWYFIPSIDKGAGKIAKKLGFDYAEAVTSFEFKKGAAFPVLQGIVIAEEHEETMLEVNLHLHSSHALFC